MNGTPEKPTGGLPHCPGFLRENLKAYLDGELSPLRRGMMRWHIAHCAHCREETVWLRRLGEDMRTLEKSAPRPELRKRILASLPPPVPMRPPAKIWRPERAVFRYAPNLALGAAAGAFALGGAFALLRVPTTQAANAVPPAPVRVTQNPPAPGRTAETIKPVVSDPFVVPAIDDPTSRRATVRYHENAHRLALLRQQEARLASGKPSLKTADIAPPLLVLTPNGEVADGSDLRRRLEALAIQAGGSMKMVSVPTSGSHHVAPSVPLGAKPVYNNADATPAAMDTPSAQIALRVPAKQIKPFLQALRTLGTLKRAAPDKNAAAKVSETKPDQSAARDTLPADSEGFVTFRIHLLPAK